MDTDTYRVRSERSGTPELNDLRASYVEEPGKVEGGTIMFDVGSVLDPQYVALERMVGARCTVTRIRDGQELPKGGAVDGVGPLRILLDGGPWR